MSYVTSEEIARAKQIDLLTYLQTYEPSNLVHFSGNTYCTREHDSLKISNGKWHWFSRGIGGKNAVDYLIKVKDYSFPQAVQALTEGTAPMPSVFHVPKTDPPKVFTMPDVSPTTHRIVDYLTHRGIHPDILDFCMENKLLFETKQYHNALFAGYDANGKMRYGALRGTSGSFKGEVPGSDKRYSFSIPSEERSANLHLFEAAIDAISYATLLRMKNRAWRKDALLSLAGVYQSRTPTVPPALKQYLKEHPEIRELHLHLDNDEIGHAAAFNIAQCLQDQYTVINKPPPCGKDVNEYLQRQISHKKEEFTR